MGQHYMFQHTHNEPIRKGEREKKNKLMAENFTNLVKSLIYTSKSSINSK